MPPRVQLGFDRGTGPIAWTIRRRDRSPVAHVRIWLDNHRWEAVAGIGVITSAPCPWPEMKIVRPECWDHPTQVTAQTHLLDWPGWTDAEIIEARAWLCRQVGKHYDTAGVLAFATGNDREAAERQRERQQSELWFCSELAAALGLRHEHPLLRRCQPYQYTPFDCFRAPALKWAIQGEAFAA